MLTQPGFLTLVAANIGAVMMPWMIFHQQSATADKGLREDDQPEALWDAAIGAVISQVVVSAVLIATAATIGHGAGTKNGGGGHASLNTVGDVANAFTPALGPVAGRLVFAGGIVAAALVAAIVVSLALAWSFGDMVGRRNSLENSPRDAPAFYAASTLAVVAGAVAVQFVDNLVALNITVEVLNALLLPLVLGLLVLLSKRALPERTRLRGWFRAVVYAVTALTLLAAMVGVLDSVGLDLTPAARDPGSKARGSAPMLKGEGPRQGKPLGWPCLSHGIKGPPALCGFGRSCPKVPTIRLDRWNGSGGRAQPCFLSIGRQPWPLASGPMPLSATWPETGLEHHAA